MADARGRQRREKAQQLAQQALQEREEYERVLEWQERQTLTDDKTRKEAKAYRSANRKAVYEQMETHGREKKFAREAFLADGRNQKIERKMEEVKLARIKEAKLQQMVKKTLVGDLRREKLRIKFSALKKELNLAV